MKSIRFKLTSRSIQIFIVGGVRDAIKKRPDWFHKSFINELTAQFWASVPFEAVCFCANTGMRNDHRVAAR